MNYIKVGYIYVTCENLCSLQAKENSNKTKVSMPFVKQI